MSKRNYAQEMWDAAAEAAREVISDLDGDVELNDDGSKSSGVHERFHQAEERALMYKEHIADKSARDALLEAEGRWGGRQDEREQKADAAHKAADRKLWRRITVDGADVTEHVAAMFDAIVGSMDWGSGFLSVEEIESILIVAELAGFEEPAVNVNPPGFDEWDPGRFPLGTQSRAYADRQRQLAEAIAAWRAQVKARAAAMRKDGSK